MIADSRSLLERTREFLLRRRTAYLRVFDHTNGRYVLADLAKFCRANESTFHTDPRMEGILQGRREVFLRIQHHLKLTPEELWKLYSGLEN
jgi:hypothetical protein